MSRRRRQALLLIAIALTIFAVPLVHYALTPAPVELRDTRFGGQIVFGTPRSRLVSNAGCMDVYWNVEGIRALKVADEPVIGTGEMTVCGRTPRLRVTFQNGVLREYSLDRLYLLTSPVRFLYGVAVVLALLALERLTGPIRRWRWVARLGAGLSRSPLARRWLGDGRALVDHARRWFRCEEPAYRYALLALVVLGAFLRLLVLNSPAGHDEINTYYQFAEPPLWIGLPRYPPPNNHFFNSFLIHIVTRLFWTDLWVMRLPVFILGVLAIPAAYAAGRVLFNRPTGLIAAALVATSSSLIRFSINARGYMYVALFFLLLIVLAAYVVRRDNRAAWALIGLLAVLGFYTLPTMFYTYGAVALWLLGMLLMLPRGERSPRLRHFLITNIAAGIITILLYLPVFLRSGVEAVTANSYVDHYSWEVYLSGLPSLVAAIWNNWTAVPPVVLGGFLLVGLIAGLLAAFRRRAFRPLWLLAATFGWIAAVMTAQRVLPFVRVFSFLLPLVFVVAAYGWTALAGWARIPERSRRLAPAFSVGLAVTLSLLLAVSGGVMRLSDIGTVQDAPALVRFLKDELQPFDTLITNNRYNTMRYYFDVNQIDTDYIWFNRRTDPRRVRRLFVLVERDIDIIEEVFEFNGLDTADYYPFEKIYSGKEADLYRSYFRVSEDRLVTE